MIVGVALLWILLFGGITTLLYVHMHKKITYLYDKIHAIEKEKHFYYNWLLCETKGRGLTWYFEANNIVSIKIIGNNDALRELLENSYNNIKKTSNDSETNPLIINVNIDDTSEEYNYSTIEDIILDILGK